MSTVYICKKIKKHQQIDKVGTWQKPKELRVFVSHGVYKSQVTDDSDNPDLVHGVTS